MKQSRQNLKLAGALLALAVTGNLLAADSPGKVDFGEFAAPGNGKQFVEINVGGGLINLATRFVEKQEPEVARLLSGIESIRVNVIGLSEGNRASIESRAKELRKKLESSGWDRIVTAQKDNQDVNIFLKMAEKEVVQGLTLMVMEGAKQEAVFINVVGNIRPEQIAMLGERLHVEELKKAGEAANK
jgi:hypothetical protein